MNKILVKAFNIRKNKKVFLIIHMFIQVLLSVLVFRALSRHEFLKIGYSTISLALIYSFIAYLVLLLNYKNKKMIYYYWVSTMVLSIFLVMDLSYLRYTDLRYGYLRMIILFILLDITLKILTQNINKKLFYKYIIIGFWAMFVVFGIFQTDIYLIVYEMTFFVLSIYPIIFLIFNFKEIKNYGCHLVSRIIFLAILNTIFFSIQFFWMKRGKGIYNYDFYIYLNAIELFLSYIVLSALGFWKLLKEKTKNINKYMIINGAFILLYLYFIMKDNRKEMEIILFLFLSIFIILKQSQLFHYYIKIESHKINQGKNEISSPRVFRDLLENSILDYKKEEIYKEQVADFLHDEILQEAIYIKKELYDKYNICPDEMIYKTADNMINMIRGQISLYKPHINYSINLSENYYNLIKSLRNRFDIDNILVDFICDEKMFLSPPYDLVIYRMMHELITNIFKHSKGKFSVIELKIEKKTIILNVTNHGDYLVNENMNNTDSRGLKIIKREVDRFGGTFEINSSVNPTTLGSGNLFDNSILTIKIRIPIKGEITYEHFINR